MGSLLDMRQVFQEKRHLDAKIRLERWSERFLSDTVQPFGRGPTPTDDMRDNVVAFPSRAGAFSTRGARTQS